MLKIHWLWRPICIYPPSCYAIPKLCVELNHLLTIIQATQVNFRDRYPICNCSSVAVAGAASAGPDSGSPSSASEGPCTSCRKPFLEEPRPAFDGTGRPDAQLQRYRMYSNWLGYVLRPGKVSTELDRIYWIDTGLNLTAVSYLEGVIGHP